MYCLNRTVLVHLLGACMPLLHGASSVLGKPRWFGVSVGGAASDVLCKEPLPCSSQSCRLVQCPGLPNCNCGVMRCRSPMRLLPTAENLKYTSDYVEQTAIRHRSKSPLLWWSDGHVWTIKCICPARTQGRMGMAHGPGPHRHDLWANPA